MFKKSTQKFNTHKKIKLPFSKAINPLSAEGSFMNKLSKTALHLYERQCDVKHFSQIVLSDINNTENIDDLFQHGVIDPFEDDKLAHLADNSRFLHDLGLIED